MIITQHKKNRISLEDYDYKWDVQNRLFLSDLTPFETDVLREVLDGSLTTTVERIADSLEVSENDIIPVLEKLSQHQLLHTQNQMVFVDKEKRKYFETHMAKFEEGFKPSVEFLQELLNKVPIHLLPSWYQIPKTSDHIFHSIIEKYMQTPKTYSSYLKQLTFDSTTLNGIFHDIYKAKNFCMRTSEIREKYKLSKEQLTECLLLLEYHLVACVSYERKQDHWEEILTPYHEWSEHLRFQMDAAPESIEDADSIKRDYPEDFAFAREMNAVLKTLEASALPISEKDEQYVHPDYGNNVIAKLIELKLAKMQDGKLHAHHKAVDWLSKPLDEQAMIIYRHPGSCFKVLKEKSIAYTDRDMRETEKNLTRILCKGWVYFDDFMRGFTGQVGSVEAVTLKNKGKRWHYTRPTYSDNEHILIERIILGRLFEAGMVATGTHEGRRCICLTPFGEATFET